MIIFLSKNEDYNSFHHTIKYIYNLTFYVFIILGICEVTFEVMIKFVVIKKHLRHNNKNNAYNNLNRLSQLKVKLILQQL